MSTRTSLILDDEVRRAAKDLAAHYQCSTSEAIRRAVLGHREVVLGVPKSARVGRVKTLKRLAELFEGHDAAAEIRRLKSEDGGF
ncbi:MAG: hypothetical protein HY791_32690 [Deltaproteobacteria bacterium]|nr:hypothetical protein [Deltaproteobacteria bacterium]